MNTFQLNLRDRAATEAKRAGTSQISQVHVAAAIAGTLQHPALRSLRERAMSSGEPSPAASITADAESMIVECVNEPAAHVVLDGFLAGRQDANPEARSGTPTGATPSLPTASTTPETPAESAASVENVLAELNALVGLQEVKAQVYRFLAVHQANGIREQQGLAKVPLSLHLVFTGDPGTGKTTVARIVGKLYQAAGLLPKGHLFETDRAGLVAGYVGQTALKVQEVLKEADGGVLFIDEAYSLANDAQEDFGQEAVAALVRGMEDRRQTMAVIAAGYHEEMSRFISMNPGLRSRFQTFVTFPNYTSDEMTEIFRRLGMQHDIDVSRVSTAVHDHFSRLPSEGNVGNGRYVRTLFEQMYANLATRAAADGKIEAHEISAFEVVDIPHDPQMTQKPRVGFL